MTQMMKKGGEVMEFNVNHSNMKEMMFLLDNSNLIKTFIV